MSHPTCPGTAGRHPAPAITRSGRSPSACATCSITLGHERATLVGHSLGGGIAMQFAYHFPEITERLVLVSSGGLGPEVSLILRAAALPGADLFIA
ncbi:MAG: alpha/beta fold hydrolase, partial [Solirubrobacteraceae bacterium]